MRFALVLLLALAIPLQGVAAVAGGVCQPADHHHEHSDGGGTPPNVKHDCCTAIGQVAPMPPLASHAPAPFVAPAAPFHGVALDRLDRPPLSL